ncbi:LysR family transcriptional regulator [Schnuerera sp. xch1]|uniref:winged helix-turn-helix domain-containing protein n=1 Tax=Schnuerera sp. xch1 TaxID=2874283 RepID=UPI001CBAAAFF|nr:LysR family transcriptional regulator [Schnuerera sp. xch1]MBZ2175177.1 LysR family transcriptional regulator [Schnuerera sp. xch1]
MKDLKLESRFWIAHDGKKVFGRGPCILLKTVDRLGSLNKAAKELNMSYSKAWIIIKRAEKMLGYPLLRTETGGANGGGSYLTSKGEVLTRVYEEFSRESEKCMEELYKKYFDDI